MRTPGSTLLRAAVAEDAAALVDLERDANLVALAHVFDPAVHAFPRDAVLARWRVLLADPEVHTHVVDAGPASGLVALVSHDRTRVRHLAVHPDRWRTGLAGLLLDGAVARIRADGGRPVLWCLVANTGARRLYEGRGWRPTGVERRSEFAPHPTEMQYALEEDPS